jgi:hypothetical protein
VSVREAHGCSDVATLGQSGAPENGIGFGWRTWTPGTLLLAEYAPSQYTVNILVVHPLSLGK